MLAFSCSFRSQEKMRRSITETLKLWTRTLRSCSFSMQLTRSVVMLKARLHSDLPPPSFALPCFPCFPCPSVDLMLCADVSFLAPKLCHNDNEPQDSLHYHAVTLTSMGWPWNGVTELNIHLSQPAAANLLTRSAPRREETWHPRASPGLLVHPTSQG